MFYERLLRAGFDERIAVVELVLKGLINRIHENGAGVITGGDTSDRNAGIQGFDTDSEADGGVATAALENAFDFMESAFGEGEEMVIFVTELTMNPDCVLFLAEHPSEAYLKYSERLLVGTRRGELLAEIKKTTY